MVWLNSVYVALLFLPRCMTLHFVAINFKSQSLDQSEMYLIITDPAAAYHIMQIVRGEKFLQLQHLVELHGKTFAVVSFVQYLID